jgi:hypothetical protein
MHTIQRSVQNALDRACGVVEVIVRENTLSSQGLGGLWLVDDLEASRSFPRLVLWRRGSGEEREYMVREQVGSGMWRATRLA